MGTQLSGNVAAEVGHTVGFTQRRGWLEGVGRTPGPRVLRGHGWSGFCRGCGDVAPAELQAAFTLQPLGMGHLKLIWRLQHSQRGVGFHSAPER